MGKKYIIELLDECNSEFKGIMVFGVTQEKQISVELIPEESLRPYTEPDTESIRKEAYDKGYTDAAYNCHESCAFLDVAKNEAYQRGYETAKHECEDCTKPADNREAYQMGLNDAWETARKITDMETEKRDKVFEETFTHRIFNQNTYSEAIEKIQQYEQKQEEQIQVGDEVITASGKAVVTGVGPVYLEYVYAKGSIGSDKVKNVKKTGRHFPELVEVLAKMKEA